MAGWMPRWPAASAGPSSLTRATLSHFAVIRGKDLYLWYWSQGDHVDNSVKLAARRPQLVADGINERCGFSPDN